MTIFEKCTQRKQCLPVNWARILLLYVLVVFDVPIVVDVVDIIVVVDVPVIVDVVDILVDVDILVYLGGAQKGRHG